MVRLVNDDCINLKRHFKNKKFDIIYMDPPFGTGVVQSLGDNSYDDRAQGQEYLNFIYERVKILKSSLSDQGVLLIHLDLKHVYEVKAVVDQMGLPFKGDIIWNYRRWSSKIDSLQKNHDTVLVYSRNLRIQCNRTIISNSIVAPSARERVGYPTQKPIALMKKILQIFQGSVCADSILDPFMGSGTTLVAAAELGIAKINGMDISKKSIQIVTSRMKEATEKSNQLEMQI